MSKEKRNLFSNICLGFCQQETNVQMWLHTSSHTCSRMCSHMHPSLDPSVNLVTQSPTLSICQNLVWSQQQNGTILFHSVLYRKRCQMTGNHKMNVIPFSEALCLSNWGKNKTNLFQCDLLVIAKLIHFCSIRGSRLMNL